MQSTLTVSLLASLCLAFATAAYAADPDIGKHASYDATDEASSEAVQALLPQIQHKNDIAYISGGVGEGERAALARMSHDFNLKVENASKGGEYTSDAQVSIHNPSGEVLAVTLDGPLLYAKLKPGTYTVTVTEGERAQKKTVKVGKGLARANFFW